MSCRPVRLTAKGHKLKDHFGYCEREVIGYLDMLATNKPERFVWPSINAIVKNCRRYRGPQYSKPSVERCLRAFQESGLAVRAERGRCGMRLGFIVQEHSQACFTSDGLCHFINPPVVNWQDGKQTATQRVKRTTHRQTARQMVQQTDPQTDVLLRTDGSTDGHSDAEMSVTRSGQGGCERPLCTSPCSRILTERAEGAVVTSGQTTPTLLLIEAAAPPQIPVPTGISHDREQSQNDILASSPEGLDRSPKCAQRGQDLFNNGVLSTHEREGLMESFSERIYPIHKVAPVAFSTKQSSDVCLAIDKYGMDAVVAAFADFYEALDDRSYRFAAKDFSEQINQRCVIAKLRAQELEEIRRLVKIAEDQSAAEKAPEPPMEEEPDDPDFGKEEV